jgi:NADH/NAD ratio-sensing transcriptional regulator Rex
MSDLTSVAAQVLATIPDGLTRGKVATGLYGLGFLGNWAFPKLQSCGVKLASCYDANEALAGTIIDGVPIRGVNDLNSAVPDFMVIAARHAVQPVDGDADWGQKLLRRGI